MKQLATVSVDELKEMAAKTYGQIVKADVDIAKNIIVFDMEYHADGEAYLLENGSKQADIWGFNLYPEKFGTDEFLEFDSMINLRPSQNNPSRDVLDESARAKIKAIVSEAVHA